ncbi:MAG: hypothetical protein FD174_4089 [Geobacteraceae bacterium]|nr:MAG: hypothetical protein FD174_4089 [Geobacteraceae bacterium]
MRRTTKYLLFAALLAAGVAGAGAAAWLAGTPDGARWLLESISRHSRLQISARKIEGRIVDRLHLEGVRITLPQQVTELDSLELSWLPFSLLAGKVAVREFTLRGVRIRDDTPVEKKPPDLVWPRIKGIRALLEWKVEQFRVDGLTYRHLDGKPVAVAGISASVAWRDTILSINDLAVISQAGRAVGSIMAGFRLPSLRLDLALTPARPVAAMSLLSIQARLFPGRSPEQLAGSIAVTGSSPAKRLLELAGEVGMTRNSFNLRDLRLTAPGRRGKVTGEGSILLTADEPVMKLRIKGAGLDLAPELGVPTDLSGTVAFEWSPVQYRGRFDLANRGKGWRAAGATGSFQGDAAGMKLAPLDASLLDGTVQGSIQVGWREGFSLSGAMRGRRLNPARVAADWTGEVNFDLAGNVARTGEAPLRGEVRGSLLESRLHGKALTGEVRAEFAGDNLRIGRLALQGKGFDLNAAGELNSRLAFSARVSDLSRLVPWTAGELRSEGWVRWRNERLSGSATGQLRNLAADGMRIASADMSARLDEGKEHPVRVAASLRKVVYGRFQADSAALEVAGTALRHTVDAAFSASGAEARVASSGAYRRGSWQGEIVRLSGRDGIGPWSLGAPAKLTIGASGISLAPLVITGVQPERLEVAGEMTRDPREAVIRAQWEGMNLARTNHWLRDVRVAGSSSGSVRLRLLAGERLVLNGNVSAAGTVTTDGQRVTVQRGSLTIDGSESGLRAGIELSLAEGGILKGTLSSSLPARPAIPEEGDVLAEWAGIDLALLRPWLPGDVNMEGRLAGRVKGKLLPGSRLDIEGDSALAQGKARWKRPGGEFNANLRDVAVAWNWEGESLRGTFTLALAEYGQARGSFQLPLPATLPIALDAQGAVRASLTGEVREKGVLTALFPGLVQESHGELDVDLRVDGRWQEPRLEGKLHLAKAGAYLPTAGVHVRDVQLTAHLEKDIIRIDSFRATSGPGHLTGTAVIQLQGWRVKEYRGDISGERFQVVYLPELQVMSAPRLNFKGTPERLVIRGEVVLPELLVLAPPTRAPAAPSKDVILEGAPRHAEKGFPVALDIQVRVALGDRILVKVEGLDAQLGGSMELTVLGLDRITSRGEIRVVKGRYKTYGVDLEIVRGRVFYAGGSIDRPTLDILALRTVGDVRAGVTVGGTPQVPVVRLYSDPAMPDVDILSYIVLGHPLGDNREQASLVAQAAGFLLARGQSVVLQDQIKRKLGLSTLEIQTGAEPTGYMGYKPITVTLPGAAPAKPAPGISQTMLTVGKYLTPQLYFSYGRSIFTGGNLFRLRYDIFKRLQVESQTGAESGVDLYYKIDFN